MIERKIIYKHVEDFLAELNDPKLYIVDVLVQAGNRIIVELGADGGLDLDLCIRLNKYIESQMDREQEDFELEVGSAGLTSPFKVLRQYQGTIGKKLELLIKGGRKEKGLLESVSQEELTLRVTRLVKLEGKKRKEEIEEVLTLSFEDILQGKLIIEF